MIRLRRVLHWLLPIAATLLLLSGTAVAQKGDEGYKQLQPGQTLQEQLPATPLVFTAYAFIWVAMLVYVFVLFNRLKKVERELVDLRSKSRATR